MCANAERPVFRAFARAVEVLDELGGAARRRRYGSLLGRVALVCQEPPRLSAFRRPAHLRARSVGEAEGVEDIERMKSKAGKVRIVQAVNVEGRLAGRSY